MPTPPAAPMSASCTSNPLEVELTLATRDEEHCAEVLQRMAEWGYVVERVR